MNNVYILKSLKFNHYYIGQTNNLDQRLARHNAGLEYWTKRYRPWSVIYKETYKTRQEATMRERYLKSHAGRNWLKKNILPS